MLKGSREAMCRDFMYLPYKTEESIGFEKAWISKIDGLEFLVCEDWKVSKGENTLYLSSGNQDLSKAAFLTV